MFKKNSGDKAVTEDTYKKFINDPFGYKRKADLLLQEKELSNDDFVKKINFNSFGNNKDKN